MAERPSYLTKEEIERIGIQRARSDEALRESRVEDIKKFFAVLRNPRILIGGGLGITYALGVSYSADNAFANQPKVTLVNHFPDRPTTAEAEQDYSITEGEMARMEHNIYTQAVVVGERNGSPHTTIIPFTANSSLFIRQKGPGSEAHIWPIEVMAQPDAFGANDVNIKATGGEIFEFSPNTYASRLEGVIVGMLEDYPDLEQAAFILQKEDRSREEVFVSARGKAIVMGEEYPNSYFLKNLPSMLRHGNKPRVALCGATLINTQRPSQKINIGTEFIVDSDPEQLGELVCASGEQTFDEPVLIHLAPRIISLTFDLPYGSRLPLVDVDNFKTPPICTTSRTGC